LARINNSNVINVVAFAAQAAAMSLKRVMVGSGGGGKRW